MSFSFALLIGSESCTSRRQQFLGPWSQHCLPNLDLMLTLLLCLKNVISSLSFWKC